MFARKIKSAFDKFIPKQYKTNTTDYVTRKRFIACQKILFKNFQKNMPYWEEGMILSRIGKMVYIIQGQKHTHKRHLNQLKKWHEMDPNNTQDEVEEPIEVIYDIFNLGPSPKTDVIFMIVLS